MYEGDTQSVLRCERCNKPFDKQSTLKRHGYYCRSRRVGNITRSRSCIACARAKARCDNRRPGCSRCITKAIECRYPASTAKVIGPRTQQNEDATAESRKSAPSLVADFPIVDNRQQKSNDGSTNMDSALVTPDLEFADLGREYLDWMNPDIEFADFLGPQAIDEIVQHPSVGSPSLVRQSTPWTDQTVHTHQAMSSSDISIPRPPTNNHRSLIRRPKMQTGAQRIANLILHNLKSYPLMMLHHNNLPPFIHPFLISSKIENNAMEPLTNCISLVHMISSGTQGSRKLFWKNVRLECERLFEEHLRLSKWELLAAMQALSIYILIRLDEGETDHNNFDALLVAAVVVIAQQLAGVDITNDTQSSLYNYSLESRWKDWTFEESRRRLCVVYRVVNMLVYFEPAAMCDLQKDLILAPLPAKKQLWEAGDEFAWKVESEREDGVPTAFALAANGELVKLDDGQLYCDHSKLLYRSLETKTPSLGTSNWEEWCSGMDGFGGLVMLAASLVV